MFLFGVVQESLEGEKKGSDESGAQLSANAAAAPASASKPGGKYVPPSMRDGASKGRGETMKSSRGMCIASLFVILLGI